MLIVVVSAKVYSFVPKVQIGLYILGQDIFMNITFGIQADISVFEVAEFRVQMPCEDIAEALGGLSKFLSIQGGL